MATLNIKFWEAPLIKRENGVKAVTIQFTIVLCEEKLVCCYCNKKKVHI